MNSGGPTGQGPESIWQHHFQSTSPLPKVKRQRLTQRVLESEARWVSLIGTPGKGRTTLLEEIVEQLQENGEPHLAVWSSHQAVQLYDLLNPDLEAAIPAMTTRLQRRADAGPNGKFTILIDDLDLILTDTHLKIFCNFFLNVPQVRVISVTLNPLEFEVPIDQENPKFFQQIPSAALDFTLDETTSLYAQTVGISQDEEGEAQVRIDRILSSTGGIPLAVCITLDRQLNSEHKHIDDYGKAQYVHALYTYMLDTYPFELLRTGFVLLLTKLSLMPRFTERHIATLFPDVNPDLVYEIVTTHGLDASKPIRLGEYVWEDSMWHMFLQWHVVTPHLRTELAYQLSDMGDVGGAFEQWFLVGDFQRAESLLRSRFLSIYETLTPEVSREIQETPTTQLHRLPLLRSLQELLDPQALPEELLRIADNLRRVTTKSNTGHSLIVLAVRAAILAQHGLRKEAQTQAESLLDDCARLLTGISEKDEIETATTEAAMISALTLLACGSYPRTGVSIPRCQKSPYLMHRRTLTLIDVARDAYEPQNYPELGQPLVGYRAFIFPPDQCVQEFDAFRIFDQTFAEALHRANAEQIVTRKSGERQTLSQEELRTLVADLGTEVTSIMQAFVQCIHLLLLGNLAGAIQLLDRSTVVEPYATILQAIFHQAKGEHQAAISVIETLEDHWGARIAAMRIVIRASSLLHRDLAEAARLTLDEAHELPDIALAQAMTLISSERDGQNIAKLHKRFIRIFNAAADVGVFKSGQLMSDRAPIRPLTRKEMLILAGLRRGLNTREIADEQFLSVGTVRTHVKRIAKKLGASGHAEILRRASEFRLFD